jgi:hypothetical protein
MLFRTRHDAPGTMSRFHANTDLFVFRQEGDVHVAEVSAERERAVELFHALLDEMPAQVDFAIECLRTSRRFVGEGLQRAEVEEAVARLEVPLVASGGVEVAVYTNDDQLSLSPMLDLWIYARSDRWLYLLLGQGFEESAELPRRTWTVARDEFTGAPEMVEAVTAAAERLTLRLA